MMALAYFNPQKKFTYDELDEISGKLPGKWTWPTKAMIWLIHQGFEVGLIEEFDYEEFVNNGEKYLNDRFGEEVGRAQAANSDVPREQEIAKEFIKLAPLKYSIPSLKDVEKLLKQNAVVIVNVNSAALYEIAGYSGHFIVICDVKKDAVVIHDPGIPPRPYVQVPIDCFMKAWGYPTKRDRNLMYIKK